MTKRRASAGFWFAVSVPLWLIRLVIGVADWAAAPIALPFVDYFLVMLLFMSWREARLSENEREATGVAFRRSNAQWNYLAVLALAAFLFLRDMLALTA